MKDLVLLVVTRIFYLVVVALLFLSIGKTEGIDCIGKDSSYPAGEINLSTDLLFWCAQESGTENWAQIYSSNSIDILDLSFGCNLGFRVGMNYDIFYDQWDTQLSYTWFRALGDSTVSSPDIVASSFLGNFYINNSTGASEVGATYRKGSIGWTIVMNVADWELGRCFNLNHGLTLHPFLGIKGGSIYQSIHSIWKDPINSSTNFSRATENIKNNFWGIGPSLGLNTKWNIGIFTRHSISLFGDFSGALMWGHWSFDDIYKNNQPYKVSVQLPSFSGAASMLRAFLGFEWDTRLSRHRQLQIRLGYEAQFWLDQLQFYSFNAGRLNNILTLQGGGSRCALLLLIDC